TSTDTDTNTDVAGAGTDTDADAGDNVAGTSTDTDADAGDNVAGTSTDTDTNTDVAGAGTDTNNDTIAQANPDIEGSGKVNPDIEGSGKVNPDIEGSGEINPDIEGSGKVNPDIEGSGEINPNIEGSGEINPDIEGSGEPNAATSIEGNGEVAPSTTNSDTVAPNDTEDAGAVATAKKGKWWWWLPLILGIPILAAIAVSGFKGKEKSDREPAIGGLPDRDSPNGGGGILNTPDDDLSTVGANTATTIGNVSNNTVNTTSKLGGAAIATGGAAIAGGTAAATNFIGSKKTTEENIDDLDIDRIESDNRIDLPDTDVDEPVIEEIPSDPVNEFTGQETRLQVTDQPTKLQADLTEDINENTSGFFDGISSAGGAAIAGGAAAIGGAAAAASGFLGDREDSPDEDLENLAIDSESENYIPTGYVSEQTTKLQTTDLDESFEAKIPNEVSQEFRGDFVLNEETDADIEELNLDDDLSNTALDSIDTIETPVIDTSIDEDTTINNPSWIDGISSAGGSAIAGGAAAIGGAAAASGFLGDRDRTETP
ncbi:hypothetical protein I4641_13365, partial [Waterburya agarophytonicola K14]